MDGWLIPYVGFLEGGEFNALISMKVLNKEKVVEIKAAAQVAFTIGPGDSKTDADVDIAKNILQTNTETTISVNYSGGGKLRDGTYNYTYYGVALRRLLINLNRV